MSERAEELRHLRAVLKSGEYDGADLMRAWIALEEYANMIEKGDDGARWRFFVEHHCDYIEGKQLREWLIDAGLRRGGLNAAIDDARRYAVRVSGERSD